MPVHNADIARVFEEIADLLEIQEANPFRARPLPELQGLLRRAAAGVAPC